MKILLSIAFSLALAPVFCAQYVGLEFGTNHLELTNVSSSGLKIGYKAGARYGYVFENGFRAELECSYRKNNVRTKYSMMTDDEVFSKTYHNYHSWAYMVNVLYDLKQLSVETLIPYVGLGVGYSQNTRHDKIKYNTSTSQDKMKDNRFAYQAIGGIKYSINADYSAALEYQYHCAQDHAKAHTVGVSLIRNF